MHIPHFPADGGVALRDITLLLESLQNRGAFRLFIQKSRQFLEADAVHIVRRNFPILIQHDHITDRQAVPMVVRRAGAVEFLVQLFQQLRLWNAALSFREISPVQDLVILNGGSDVLLVQRAHGSKAERRVYILLQLHDQITVVPALLELLHPIGLDFVSVCELLGKLLLRERDAVLVPQIVAVQDFVPHLLDHQFGRVNFPTLQQAAVALIERILPRAIICRLHSEIIVVFQIPRPLLLLR